MWIWIVFYDSKLLNAVVIIKCYSDTACYDLRVKYCANAMYLYVGVALDDFLWLIADYCELFDAIVLL